MSELTLRLTFINYHHKLDNHNHNNHSHGGNGNNDCNDERWDKGDKGRYAGMPFFFLLLFGLY